MDDTIRQLLEIQDRDQRIFQLNRQILSVPEEKERIRNELQASNDGVDAAKQAVIDFEKAIKKIELDVDSLKAKIADLQIKQLAVRKNDEYRALGDQADKCKKQICDLEDRELELWEDLEGAKVTRAAAEKDLDANKRRIESAINDLDVREKNSLAQIDKVQEERNGLTKDVPEEEMHLYERLAKRKTGKKVFIKVVVAINNEICGGCNLKLTPYNLNQARKQLTVCDNCGCVQYYE
jgi:predicted  nucleic acid-binding Zn-ribbon protein